jgi:SAM-dependent methyltransferase
MLDKLKNIFTKNTESLEPVQETNEVDDFIESVKENPDIFATEYLLNDPRIVGWTSVNEQFTIYSAFTMFYDAKSQSVLDVGCGRADLYGYLTNVYENPYLRYYGVDENPNMVSLAKSKYPNVQVEHINILDMPMEIKYDWVIASGLFNYPKNNDIEYVKTIIDSMMQKSSNGIAFNFITSLPDDVSDEDRESLNVYDLGFWVNYLVSKYQKVIVRSDYMIGDATIFIFN